MLSIKRLAILVAVVGLSAFAPQRAMAQIDLGRALGQLFGAVVQQQPQAEKSPYDLLKENAPQRSKVLGTWQYKSARIEYLGDNPLATVAIQQLETLGVAELQKLGIIEGCCSLTLRRNGLAVVATRDQMKDVYYTYDETSAKVTGTFDYLGTEYSARGYLKLPNCRLVVMIDALDVLNTLAATSDLATDDTFLMVKGVVEGLGGGVFLSVLFER